MVKLFPARKVKITRVYLLDCDDCDAAWTDLGHCTTRREADQAKRDHVRWHRTEGAAASTPDPPRAGPWGGGVGDR